jgi:biopolymer transport protein TolR
LCHSRTRIAWAFSYSAVSKSRRRAGEIWKSLKSEDFHNLQISTWEETPVAMDLGPKGSLKADINVTPLIDVMLVLLIIMMLIAPMLPQGVPVALPEANNAAEKPDTQKQTVVAIDASSNFWVNTARVAPGELVTRVQRALEDKREKVVYVKGDKDAKYSAVMDAMDALRKAQIENIALITEPKGDNGGNTAGVGR